MSADTSTSLAEAWEALTAQDPARYPAEARGPFMAGALSAMELRQKRGDAAVFAEIAQYGRVVGTAAESRRGAAR